MEGKPKCKKCGRVLKSPASIALGMGPKCSGITALSGRSAQVRIKRDSATVFQVTGQGRIQAPFFLGNLPTKSLSKRELFRQHREERKRLFETHEPFQCGILLPKRKPLIYEPLADGNWKENPSGRVISHERLQEYLMRYRFI